jgi:DNA-binding HxlR family transcriptional regulator
MKLVDPALRAKLIGMKTYGQYCPIARTSELLAERWTPLIIRNLLTGCRTYGEIRAGLPGIPTALLSERLALLERHDVLRRIPKENGRGSEYELTERGIELKEICDSMGRWGARWLEVEPWHTDPGYVLWATAKLTDTAKLPGQRTVVRFELNTRPRKAFWMILQEPPEVCTTPPGFPEDLIVKTTARCLIEVNLRQTTMAEASRQGRLVIEGVPSLVRRFPTWFRPSPYAGARHTRSS